MRARRCTRSQPPSSARIATRPPWNSPLTSRRRAPPKPSAREATGCCSGPADRRRLPRRPCEKLACLLRVDAKEQTPLAARADGHVAVDEEREAAEHPLLGDALLRRQDRTGGRPGPRRTPSGNYGASALPVVASPALTRDRR